MGQSVEDVTLVQSVTAGDRSAFTRLVERYKTYVYSVAYKKIGNFHDAQDIAQLVFTEVYQDIARLRNPAKLVNWLHGITERVSLNWLRKYRPRTVSLDNLNTQAVASNQNNPLETLIQQEETSAQWKRAWALYNALEEPYQVVLNLKYMEDLSYDEMARRLGISKDAVGVRLYRAHQRLDKLISETSEETL